MRNKAMCIKPIWLRKRQQEVPCGKCFECVKRRRNDWYARCWIEANNSRHVYAGLLTYASTDMTLNIRDVQLFLKRLRHKEQLRYLIAGEFGDKRGRPHWHCIFFSQQQINYNNIKAAWNGGYKKDDTMNKAGWINFGPIRSARALRYCVKYLYKYDGTEKHFEILMSRNPGIGYQYLQNQTLHLSLRTSAFRLNGVAMAMPRYYKRKFFDDYEDIKQEINEKLADKVRELREAEIMELHRLHPELQYQELENLLQKLKEHKNEHIRKSERNR